MAASVAHALGKPVVAAESFTGHRDEKGRNYPWSLKNQADWALATGINQFQLASFTHQPLGEKGLPGMTMGAWGIRWDRGQTWWPMVSAFHLYLARCSHLLRQGNAVLRCPLSHPGRRAEHVPSAGQRAHRLQSPARQEGICIRRLRAKVADKNGGQGLGVSESPVARSISFSFCRVLKP